MDTRVPTSRLLAAAALAGALAGAPPAGAAARGCASPSAQRRVAAAAHFARVRFGLERYGIAVHVALRRVAADRRLTDAVRVGDLRAAAEEAVRLVLGHQHITAIRVVRGRRVLIETNVHPFDVAGAQTPLRDRRGIRVGTLHLTVQDVIGYIRLVHKYGASQIVVRGARGRAESSLPAALAGRLPAAGCATVAGRSYAVRSFPETSFTGEPLTVWILKAS